MCGGGGLLTLIFFFLVGFSKLFSKAHNIWNRFLPNLVAYLQYFKQRWFLLTFSYILKSLNQQTTLQFFVRVRISLSTSLYIQFSPILSITCLNKQTNKQRNSTIPLNVNKITVHHISKGILWPVSGIHCFKKSSSLSPQSCQNIQLQKRDFQNAILSNPARDLFFQY